MWANEGRIQDSCHMGATRKVVLEMVPDANTTHDSTESAIDVKNVRTANGITHLLNMSEATSSVQADTVQHVCRFFSSTLEARISGETLQ